MVSPLHMVFFLIGLAFIFDVFNGFHDAANSVATVVTTRVLSPIQAVFWAAFFNFVAAFLFGTGVAKTISDKLIDPKVVDLYVIFGGLVGAIIWDIITWLMALPTSSSHAIISAYAGGAIAKAGFGALLLKGWVPVITFLVVSPIIDVGVVSDRGCNDLSMRRSHSLGHRAPHSTQGFGRSSLGKAFRSPLDISPRDGVIRPAGLYSVEIHVELVCERPYRWKHLKPSSRLGLRKRFHRRSLLFASVELADHSAGILLTTLGELDQGSAYFQQIAFGAKHAHNATAAWRRHLDHGLVGLDRDEWLISNHVIPLVHMPGHDLGLFETFAKVGQHELSHGMCPAGFN